MKLRRSRPSGKTAAPPHQKQQQVYCTNKAEVLELVVTFTHDAVLLAKATVLSTYYRDIALTSVQQQLPTLLGDAVKQATDSQDYALGSKEAAAFVKGAVHWLCAAAGREAVSQPEVTAALLAPNMVQPAATASGKRRWAWEPTTKKLAGSGLTLSDAVVAAAARQQLPTVLPLLSACCDAQEGMQGSTADYFTGGLSKLYAATVADDLYGLKEELKADSTSATTVVDLLFIAINEGAYDTFQELRKFDEAHTRAVNIDRSNLTAPVPATSARATRSSSSSSQPEESQLQPPAQVYEQLILTCIVAGRIWWLSGLVEYKLYPVAADVDVAGVAKLMHTAAMLGNSAYSHHENPNMLSLLAKLPAAKDITPGTIASVFRTLVHSKRTASQYSESDSLSGLFDLPGASGLSSRDICDMLLLAVRKGKDTRGYLDDLSQLANSCEMKDNDIMALLTTMLEEQGCEDFCETIGYLEHMTRVHFLSIEDTLTLLTRICEGKRGTLRYSDNPHTSLQKALNTLRFTHKKFHKKDVPSFVAFLKVLVRIWSDEYLEDVVHTVLKANKGPTLNHQHYMQLLRFCVEAGRLPSQFVSFPASKSVAAGEVFQLLQLCFARQPPRQTASGGSSCCSDEGGSCLYLIRVLTRLPHAKMLTVDSIMQLMQRTLQEGDDSCSRDDALSSLAVLPLARQISTADACALVLTAFEKERMTELDSLCKCMPACVAAWEEFNQGEVLQQRLQKALAGDRGEEVCTLLQHAQMQQYAADVLPRVLLAAFRSCGCNQQHHGMFTVPFWPLTAKKQTGQHAGEDIKLNLSQAQLLQLLRLPAAACLSAPVLCELMQLSLQRMEGALMQELVRLPAAQQLSDADIALLLRLAAGQTAAGSAGLTAAAVGSGQGGDGSAGGSDKPAAAQPPRLSRSQHTKRGQVQQPQPQEPQPKPQQQESETAASGVLPGLVLQCLQQPKGAAGLFPLLLLPWAQQLPAACVKALLQAAAERHARVLFERLLQLPQAPRDDAEVQVYAEVVRFSCAAADLTDFAPQEKKREQLVVEEDDSSSLSSSSESGLESSEG